jgi:hypothetical protein
MGTLQPVNIILQPVRGDGELWIIDSALRQSIEQSSDTELEDFDVLLAGDSAAISLALLLPYPRDIKEETLVRTARR